MIGPLGYYTVGNVSWNKPIEPVSKVTNTDPIGKDKMLVNETRPAECQTCKNRRYVDASNDSNVSFQTPTHISPKSSYAMVSAHEQEHVTNAYRDANQKGGRVVYASVVLKWRFVRNVILPM